MLTRHAFKQNANIEVKGREGFWEHCFLPASSPQKFCTEQPITVPGLITTTEDNGSADNARRVHEESS